MTKIGVYPGTFDPITSGHVDIISRAMTIVDHLIIAVAGDTGKDTIFNLEERTEMVQKELDFLNTNGKKVEARAFNGLLVDFVTSCNSSLIIRGLRAVSDFEYEFQMSCMNMKLNPEIETIFMPASERTHFISSRLVKEVIRLHGDVSGFVSKYVQGKLMEKYRVRNNDLMGE
jgi:pantetheine-phosphate adenylyltransferase